MAGEVSDSSVRNSRDALWSAAWSDVTLHLSLPYPDMATALSSLTGLAFSRVPGSAPADIVIKAGRVAGDFVVLHLVN